MRQKQIITAISLLAVGVGVSPTTGAIIGQAASKQPARSQKKQSVTRRDQTVLEALLLDLLSYDEYGERLGKRGTQIAASPTTTGPAYWLDSDIKNAADLKMDLRRRNVKPVSLKDVKFTHKNILVRDMRELPSSLFAGEGSRWNAFGNLKMRGCYELSLPGYSRDGRRAIVPFHAFLPGEDYAMESAGDYILRKRRGRWKVVRRYVLTGE